MILLLIYIYEAETHTNKKKKKRSDQIIVKRFVESFTVITE